MSARHEGAVSGGRERQVEPTSPKTGFQASVAPEEPAETVASPKTGFQASVAGQLADLRARAEAATDSQWEQEWWRCHAEDYFMSGMAGCPDLVAYFTTLTPAVVLELLNVVADLRSRIGCVVEATYWDRPYDTRIAAIRGMCDLTTDGMTPKEAGR